MNNPLPQLPANALGPNGKGGRRASGAPVGLGGELDSPRRKALGVTQQELMQDLRNGKSIADIAKDKNVDVNKVIDDSRQRREQAHRRPRRRTESSARDQAAKAKDAAKKGDYGVRER